MLSSSAEDAKSTNKENYDSILCAHLLLVGWLLALPQHAGSLTLSEPTIRRRPRQQQSGKYIYRLRFFFFFSCSSAQMHCGSSNRTSSSECLTSVHRHFCAAAEQPAGHPEKEISARASPLRSFSSLVPRLWSSCTADRLVLGWSVPVGRLLSPTCRGRRCCWSDRCLEAALHLCCLRRSAWRASGALV